MTCVSPSIRSLQDGIARTLLAALEADLAKNCATAIAAVQRENPGDYLRIALSVLPKEGTPEKADVDLSPRQAPGIARGRPPLTAQRLRELLDYDPATGIFRWRQSRGVKAGARAGCQYGTYRTIHIDRVQYYAHRLAWLHVYGEHPPHEIDHVNADPSDDRIANLRSCTHRENSRNRRGGRGASGLKGVCQRASGRWCATISLDGKNTHLGSFDTKEEAAAAYDAAARRHFGEFARTNDSRDGRGR